LSGRRLPPLIAATVATVACLTGPRVEAQERDDRVGIVIAVQLEVTNDEADHIGDAMADAVRTELHLDTIAGAEARRRLPPGGIPQDCLSDASCRNDIGRRLDADQLLFVATVSLAGETQIDTTWTDVGSGRMMSRPKLIVGAGADLASLMREHVHTLIPETKQEKPAPAQPAAAPAKVVVIHDAPRAEVEGSGRHMTWPVWTAAGIGLAALAGGTVFALRANDDYNNLEDANCRDFANPTCTSDKLDQGKTNALVADVLFVSSVAAGATAAVLYVLSADESPPAVGVTASNGGLTMAWQGRF